MTSQQNRLIMFTSLPRVGGHTTITLGLCRLLKPHFSELIVWCRTMPEHGYSTAAAKQLEDMGCRVELLADQRGRLSHWKVIKLALREIGRSDTRLFVLTMGYLSFILALVMAKEKSIYYYITHDLSAGTVRRLALYTRVFEKLVFICPATYHEFSRAGSRPEMTSWAVQCSEMPTGNVQVLSNERLAALGENRPIRFGVIGRLTEQKGSAEILRVIDANSVRCEFHIAGNGPFAQEFKERQYSFRDGDRVKVLFYGAYEPTERVEFLRNFFLQVDFLIVPTLDQWETLCMALLEGLQHGVPCIATRTGGLTSFEMHDLGPPLQSVVRLIDPARVFEILQDVARSPRPPIEQTASECRNYYEAFFSDKAVANRWLEIVGCANNFPENASRHTASTARD